MPYWDTIQQVFPTALRDSSGYRGPLSHHINANCDSFDYRSFLDIIGMYRENLRQILRVRECV